MQDLGVCCLHDIEDSRNALLHRHQPQLLCGKLLAFWHTQRRAYRVNPPAISSVKIEGGIAMKEGISPIDAYGTILGTTA